MALTVNGLAGETDTVKAKPVVVSAARVVLPISRIPRTIDVITQKMLSAMPIRSMSDVLSYVPGVDLRQRGPYGIQGDVSMRGGSFEQTAVLVDGMRMNDVQTGHHTLNLPIMPEEIERIEVVKGGSTRLYGPGALDGAINYITKRGGQPHLMMNITGGDFGFVDGRVYATTTTGDVSHRTGIQYMKTDGYMPSTDAELKSALYSGNVDVGATTAQWQAGVSDRMFGANGYYSPNFPNQWEHTTTWHASASTVTMVDTATTVTFRGLYRINNDDFMLKRDNPSFYENLHTTHTLTGLGLVSHVWEAGTTTVGVEAGHDDILSTNLGTHTRFRGGLSLEHSIMLSEAWLVAAGVSNTMYSDRTPGIGYGADVSFRPSDQGRIFITANRSYRVPTYTELYYKDPQFVGNAALKPETAITVELGSEWTVGDFLLRGALYRRNGQNMIDYAPQSDPTLPMMAENIAEIIVNGFEAGISAYGLRVSVNYNDVSSTQPTSSRYTRDQLRWQGIADYTVMLPFEISTNIKIRVLERIGNTFSNCIGDLRFKRTFESVTVMAEATNIWNENYIETGWVTMPPRWFRVGVEWNASLQ